mmetsp:Transcript_51165/g.59785  ORF Transcript_51165/g.59785 Transcript_51165/m.59785 type:complete len:95 (-) Transcript_51165:435-719(-)
MVKTIVIESRLPDKYIHFKICHVIKRQYLCVAQEKQKLVTSHVISICSSILKKCSASFAVMKLMFVAIWIRLTASSKDMFKSGQTNLLFWGKRG